MLLPRFRQPEHDISAWSDLKSVFSQRHKYQWLFMAASIAIPVLLIAGFLHDSSMRKEYKPPEIIFVEQWKLGRTDAEVKAQQVIDAPKERAERKAWEDAKAAQRKEYQKLADRYGIDVERK